MANGLAWLQSTGASAANFEPKRPKNIGEIIGRPNPQNLTPGNPKATGRPKDTWKAALVELASRDETLNHVKKVLDAGADHQHFFKALDYCTDHGFGKAQSSVDVTSGGETLKFIVGVDPEQV